MISDENLVLSRLRVEFGDAYLDMVDEFVAAGEGYPYNNIDLARTDFAAYVQELDDEEHGIGVPPGIAPQVTYALVRDGKRSWAKSAFGRKHHPDETTSVTMCDHLSDEEAMPAICSHKYLSKHVNSA